ncbi:MAG: hypothetical protein ACTHMS_06435 [Jatrophihabitans sp.]|uniref:hypothetical protein n=1 Tax=Jatrophihabitans sp. TaxID=1932789 RepID=UPI003F7D2B5E
MLATEPRDRADAWSTASALAASVADAAAFGEPAGATIDGLGRWLRRHDADELRAHRDDVDRMLDLLGPRRAALVVRWLMAHADDAAARAFWAGLRRHLHAVA